MRFDELVGGDDLTPEEEARLRRVHDLLVQAGPPPDLPPELERPTRPPEAEIVQFPLLPRRRWALAVVAAVALLLVAFAGGYLVGHSKPGTFDALRVVPMHGANALAVLRVGHSDSVGNWPMVLEVNGLPQQSERDAYYELWLTKHGKPTLPCGSFRAAKRTTTVRLSVPYSLRGFDGWVITRESPHDRGHPGPGPVILTT
jgi:Anti-sigma-K factor rskA